MSQKNQPNSMICMEMSTIATTQTILTTTTPMRRNLIEAQKESSQETMIPIMMQSPSIRKMRKSSISDILGASEKNKWKWRSNHNSKTMIDCYF